MTSTATYKDKEKAIVTLNNGMRVTTTYFAAEDCFYWGRVKVARADVASEAKIP